MKVQSFCFFLHTSTVCAQKSELLPLSNAVKYDSKKGFMLNGAKPGTYRCFLPDNTEEYIVFSLSLKNETARTTQSFVSKVLSSTNISKHSSIYIIITHSIDSCCKSDYGIILLWWEEPNINLLLKFKTPSKNEHNFVHTCHYMCIEKNSPSLGISIVANFFPIQVIQPTFQHWLGGRVIFP